MTITLPPEAEAHFKASLEKEARELAHARLYNGSEAVKAFGITRSSLPHIPATYLPGRSKPMYAARAILNFLKNREQTKP